MNDKMLAGKGRWSWSLIRCLAVTGRRCTWASHYIELRLRPEACIYIYIPYFDGFGGVEQRSLDPFPLHTWSNITVPTVKSRFDQFTAARSLNHFTRVIFEAEEKFKRTWNEVDFIYPFVPVTSCSSKYFESYSSPANNFSALSWS